MSNSLKPDATLADLRITGRDAQRFVRCALDTMRRAQRDHGPLLMRMGVTGTGQAPNYRFENRFGKPILAIDGANHAPWPPGASFDGLDNWSSATNSFEDVENLLRSMTGYSGR